MSRFALRLLALVLAIAPNFAGATAARGQSPVERVQEKIYQQLQERDMPLRVTPILNVCGSRDAGYRVDVLLRTTISGRAVLQRVKTYTVIERAALFGDGLSIVNCGQ